MIIYQPFHRTLYYLADLNAQCIGCFFHLRPEMPCDGTDKMTAVREIRRSGLLLAVELGEPQKLYRIMELFKQAGILSDWFLFCDTAFRISPPLTISEEEIRGSSVLILKCLDELG